MTEARVHPEEMRFADHVSHGRPSGQPELRSPADPLRLGLLVDDLTVPAWAARELEEALRNGTVEVPVIVVNVPQESRAPEPSSRRFGSRAATWWRNRNALPYALYSRIDGRRYPVGADAAHVPVDLASLCPNAQVMHVSPRRTRFCDYFPEGDVAELRSMELDVVLRLGFRILKGPVLDVAVHGVWSFHHGDNRVNRGGPPGFWEVMLGEQTTGATLQRLTEDLDGGIVLDRSSSSTNPVSVVRNRENYYWQAARLLGAALRRLHSTTGEGTTHSTSTEHALAGAEWNAYSHRLYTAPGAGEMVRLAARTGLRLARRKIRSLLVREQWLVAYRLAPEHSAQHDVPDGTAYRYRELQPPSDRYWADPFPVSADGRYWLFFEEHLLGEPHAHIAVAEITRDGPVLPATVVLKRPFHLSYPSVFRWRDDWWMTPESAELGSVQLFRATRFPFEWTHEADLLTDVMATDPTLVEVDGRWWMFAGVLAAGSHEATMLHLYSASTPLGPWTPHVQNPVKVDVKGARPAGRLFRHNGAWYRPSQDGAPEYGSAVIVHRIERLDDTAYREREVARLEPRWRPGLVGTHTINAAGALSALDARQVRARFW